MIAPLSNSGWPSRRTLDILCPGARYPLLAVAGAVDVAVPALKNVSKYLQAVSVLSSVLLIGMGLLLVTDLFEQLVFRLNSLG